MQIPLGCAKLSSRAATFDPVAVNLFALEHHIAEVDANAKLHPTIRRQSGVFRLERGLDLDGALHRVDYAGKFSQRAITGGIHEPAAMLRDQRVDDFAMTGESG
jgi:hypothetical protein